MFQREMRAWCWSNLCYVGQRVCGGGSKSCDVTSEILTESADAQVNEGWNWVKARKPCGSYL